MNGNIYMQDIKGSISTGPGDIPNIVSWTLAHCIWRSSFMYLPDSFLHPLRTVFDAWPVRRQTNGCIHSNRASSPLVRCQIILLGTEEHACGTTWAGSLHGR